MNKFVQTIQISMNPTNFCIFQVDEATILKVCDIYDWDGKGELDLFFLGDVVYACGLNTTKKMCVSLGQTDEEGKKFAKYDEIVEKVQAANAAPDSNGTYKDYMQLCKLYDKQGNGTMMLGELENILANLGKNSIFIISGKNLHLTPRQWGVVKFETRVDIGKSWQ